MKRQTQGIINGAIAAASYGTNPLFALPLFAAGIGVNSVLFYRYAFAVFIYGLWIFFVKKDSLKITSKEFFPLLFLGLFFSLSSLTLFEAFRYIEAGIACTVLFIYPVIVAVIMALFFKEKVTKTVIFSILLTFTGILMLYNGKPGASLNLYGVCVVLLSALLYALYIVGIKNIKSVKHMKTDKLSFYVMLFGLLVYVFNLKFCTELQIIDKPLLWLCTIALSVFPTIISLETLTIGIKLVGSTTTAVLGALEPLTAILFGIIFFNQHLTVKISVGIALVLCGVIMIITRKKQKTCPLNC